MTEREKSLSDLIKAVKKQRAVNYVTLVCFRFVYDKEKL